MDRGKVIEEGLLTYQGSLFGATEDRQVAVKEVTLELVVGRVVAGGAGSKHDVHGSPNLHEGRLLTCCDHILIVTRADLPCVVHRHQLQREPPKT